jgi:cysteinyl-tRNA synthetase
VEKAESDFDAGLADDVNTAIALAAVFELVRDVNTAMDAANFLQQDAPACWRRWRSSTRSWPSWPTMTMISLHSQPSHQRAESLRRRLSLHSSPRSTDVHPAETGVHAPPLSPSK